MPRTRTPKPKKPPRVRRSQPKSPRDLVPNFAKLVKKTREALGWTQSHLAATADVSPMCICDLEARRRSPSLRTAIQITRALNIGIRLVDANEKVAVAPRSDVQSV
jgi:ribosome-binding protein aMBF1 (putative translation factor)